MDKTLEQRVADLKDIAATQNSDGNWNVNEYMRGMANGLLLAVSCFDDESPSYRPAPTNSAEYVARREGALLMLRECIAYCETSEGGLPVNKPFLAVDAADILGGIDVDALLKNGSAK